VSANLIPPPPYRLEPIEADDSEIGILAGDEQIATVYDYVKCLEQRP
jgi:hypothetical protein